MNYCFIVKKSIIKTIMTYKYGDTPHLYNISTTLLKIKYKRSLMVY